MKIRRPEREKGKIYKVATKLTDRSGGFVHFDETPGLTKRRQKQFQLKKVQMQGCGMCVLTGTAPVFVQDCLSNQ